MLPPTPLPFPHLVSLLLSALAATASAAASPAPSHPSTAVAPSAAPSLDPPAPEATAAQPAPPGGVHLPLHRRNGHLHHLSRRSRADQEDIVRSWAVRERGRLLGKYGQSEARLRRRDGAAPESPVGAGDESVEGARAGPRARRGGEGGEAALLERRQFGAGGALSSRTTASTTTTTTGTAFRTAGFGTSTSGTDSGSGSSTSSGTKTAPTRIPTQSSSVGEVHLVNYDADLCVPLPHLLQECAVQACGADALLSPLQVLLRAHRHRRPGAVPQLHPRYRVRRSPLPLVPSPSNMY